MTTDIWGFTAKTTSYPLHHTYMNIILYYTHYQQNEHQMWNIRFDASENDSTTPSNHQLRSNACFPVLLESWNSTPNIRRHDDVRDVTLARTENIAACQFNNDDRNLSIVPLSLKPVNFDVDDIETCRFDLCDWSLSIWRRRWKPVTNSPLMEAPSNSSIQTFQCDPDAGISLSLSLVL